MIVLIDNYDSFAHNLARYLRRLGQDVRVFRNDALDVEDLHKLAPSAVVLSPGPCTPAEAGICVPLVKRWHATFPILGICLGHQAIAVAFGAALERTPPVHGRADRIWHEGSRILDPLPAPFSAGRYHSLSVVRATLPSCLRVTAQTSDGIVMAIEHTEHLVVGLQFHPESILTPDGYTILERFLEAAGCGSAPASARGLWRAEWRRAAPVFRRQHAITPIPF